MPRIASDISSITSLPVLNFLEINPWIIPGNKNNKNIKGTIERIIGAVKEVNSPLASGKANQPEPMINPEALKPPM